MPASEDGSTDPRPSSYGRAYWLRRCEGFVVETSTSRIGRLDGIRYGLSQDEPEALAVRAGRFESAPLVEARVRKGLRSSPATESGGPYDEKAARRLASRPAKSQSGDEIAEFANIFRRVPSPPTF